MADLTDPYREEIRQYVEDLLSRWRHDDIAYPRVQEFSEAEIEKLKKRWKEAVSTGQIRILPREPKFCGHWCLRCWLRNIFR